MNSSGARRRKSETDKPSEEEWREDESLFVPLPTFLALYCDHRLATSNSQETVRVLWAKQMAKLQILWGWVPFRGIWSWMGWPWVMSPGNCVAMILVFRLKKMCFKTLKTAGFKGTQRRYQFKNFPHIQAVKPVTPSHPMTQNQSITLLPSAETFQTPNDVRLFVSTHKKTTVRSKSERDRYLIKRETSKPCTWLLITG